MDDFGLDAVLEVCAENPDGTPVTATLVPNLDENGGGLLEWNMNESSTGQLPQVRAKYKMMTAMLKDKHRNEQYEAAILAAVTAFKSKNNGKGPLVLDIGAGTGFLSMLAVRAGAKKVIGCEMNVALASIASKVIAANGMTDKISIVPSSSFEIQVGSEDFPERADLLITETLDSVLIREGIIPIVNHARAHLLKPGASVIPQSATVVVQALATHGICGPHTYSPNLGLVATKDGMEWYTPTPQEEKLLPEVVSDEPQEILLHADALLKQPNVSVASEPVEVLHVDFTAVIPERQYHDDCVAQVTSSTAKVDGLLMWWKLQLFDGISIDTEPCADSSEKWQDHWHQALVFTGTPIDVEAGDTLKFDASRNETSIHLCGLRHEPRSRQPKRAAVSSAVPEERVVHDCFVNLGFFHRPEQRWLITDTSWNRIWDSYINALKGKLPSVTSIAELCDGAQLATSLAVHFPHANVHSVEVQASQRELWKKLSTAAVAMSGTSSPRVLIVSSIAEVSRPIDCVVGRLWYKQIGCNILLSALNYFFQCKALRSTDLLSERCMVFPSKIQVWGAFVQAPSLYRANGPLGSVLGLKHEPIDAQWSDWFENETAYPMWQFQSEMVSEPKLLCTLHNSIGEISGLEQECNFKVSKTCNVHALVVFVRIYATEDCSPLWCNGDLSEPNSWNQSVKFLPEPVSVDDKNPIAFSVNTRVEKGSFVFQVS